MSWWEDYEPNYNWQQMQISKPKENVMAIPNKGFFDPEPTDSVKHHEQRTADIRAAIQSEQNVNADIEVSRAAHDKTREELARDHEIKFLEDQVGLVREGETREMLLNRIRRMREVKVEEPRYIGRTPEQEEQLKREQADGRAAVARAEAAQAANREIWRKQEEEEKRRRNEPELNPVHHPNPDQNEQYPATGATLRKRK